MTNWRIETIYAFVYLKVLPLFTETRKMGIVWQEADWEGRARLQPACVFHPCWAECGPAQQERKPGGASPFAFLLNFTSNLSIDRREPVSPKRPGPIKASWRKFPLFELSLLWEQHRMPEHEVKNAAVVWWGTGPAIFPLPGKTTWPFEQFVKTTLELRGWVGVKRGEKGRKRLEPVLQHVPFICVLSKSTWVAPCRNPERIKVNVRRQSTTERNMLQTRLVAIHRKIFFFLNNWKVWVPVCKIQTQPRNALGIHTK